jgi:hypothetical protein
VQTAIQTLLGDQAAMTRMLGDPSGHAILTKLLGQQGIAATEKEMAEGGASLRGGATMMSMAMKQLNASPEMAREAVEQITKYQLAQAQYAQQKWGKDFLRFSANKNNDVTKFDDYYSTKYPMSQVVPPIQLKSETPPAAPTRTYTDQDAKNWAKQHKTSEAAARHILGLPTT